MTGQGHKFVHGFYHMALVQVQGVIARGRYVVLVRAGLAFRRDAHGFAAGQRHFVEVLLRGVLRGGQQVYFPALFVYAHNADHVIIAGREQLFILAVAGYAVEVTPAVFFTHPNKSAALFYPVPAFDLVIVPTGFNVYPGFILFGIDGAYLAAGGVCQHQAGGVLFPVELLQDQLLLAGHPFHTGNVMLLRVSGYLQPGGFAGLQVYYAHFTG